MRASLADQPGARAAGSLAIALGANLPSPAGDPIATLVAVRPQIEQLLQAWWVVGGAEGSSALHCHWSPLFATEPVGGPAEQPTYCNAVVLVEGLQAGTGAAAEGLLQDLHRLEQQYGRQRRERWGPRSLDLDLLWWGELRHSSNALALPHPRWKQRPFVLTPLLAIQQRQGVRLGLPPGAGLSSDSQAPPRPLPPRLGWPE